MEYVIDKKESDQIRILRIICALLVVFHHAGSFLGTYTNYAIYIPRLYNAIKEVLLDAAVPIFFIISAILLYKKEFNYNENLKKKCSTLLVPYFILNALWIILYYLLQKNPAIASFYSDETIIKNLGISELLYRFGITTSLPICQQLWFLRDLFILNIFAPIIKKIIDKFPYFIFFVIFLWLFFPPNIYIYIYIYIELSIFCRLLFFGL